MDNLKSDGQETKFGVTNAPTISMLERHVGSMSGAVASTHGCDSAVGEFSARIDTVAVNNCVWNIEGAVGVVKARSSRT